MSLVEIDVRINDDTDPGWASVMAKYNAMAAAMKPIPIRFEVDTGGISAATLADSILRIGTYSQQSAHALEDINIQMARFGQNARDDGSAGRVAVTTISLLGVAAGRAAGWFGALGQKVALWGGAFNNLLPAWLAGATYLHLLVDGVVELAGVLVPATLGMVAFGAAAVPTVQAIMDHMSQLNEVVSATGHNIYPLTGAFQQAAAAAKPYVYQLWGDALVIAGNKSGMFTQVVGDVGQALAGLGARFQMAIDNGNGLGQTMQYAARDVAGIGSIIGNLGGILGTVFRAVPGYAQVFLNMANVVTHTAEGIVNASEPLLHFGLIAHGAFLYAGLAATGFANVLPRLLVGIGNFAANLGMAGGRLASFGTLGERAAGGLRSFGVAAAGASALPWGWIAVAAAGLGLFVYWALSAKTATQEWLGSLQSALGSANALHGYSLLMADQAEVASRLGAANQNLAHTYQQTGGAISASGRVMINANTQLVQAKTQSSQLAAGLKVLGDQTQLYDYRVRGLIPEFGSWRASQAMVVASGVPMSLMLNKSSTALAQIRAQVLATTKAYQSMGQVGGVLGSDLAVINRLSSDQYTNMQKLDQAWATFLRQGTGLESTFSQLVGNMRQVDNEAAKARASFTGVNTASLNLRSNFSQLLDTTQSVVASMRDAHAPASALAAEIGTVLKGAVNAGALENQAFYQTAASMAQQAGYTGNSVGQLKNFIDQNATSTQKLSNITNQYGQNLTKLPTQKHTTITNTAASANAAVRGYIANLAAIPTSKTTYINVVTTHTGHAYGGITGAQDGMTSGGLTMVGEQGPELLDLPLGTRVFSNPDTQSMMMSGAYGGGGGPTSVTLEIQAGGASAFEQFMIVAIRNWVRTRGGGSVQKAFGYGTGK